MRYLAQSYYSLPNQAAETKSAGWPVLDKVVRLSPIRCDLRNRPQEPQWLRVTAHPVGCGSKMASCKSSEDMPPFWDQLRQSESGVSLSALEAERALPSAPPRVVSIQTRHVGDPNLRVSSGKPAEAHLVRRLTNFHWNAGLVRRPLNPRLGPTNLSPNHPTCSTGRQRLKSIERGSGIEEDDDGRPRTGNEVASSPCRPIGNFLISP
jgi:hypothetical protein